ncbi:hypothetical protein LXL04_020264 [Taraxacum kok-saghyz]
MDSTMIRDLTLDIDDYMIKVTIIRLWKLTNFSNRNNVYEINMILMDEEGNSAFVIGTIKVIEQDQPWFYLACSNCKRKVQVVKATNDEYGDVAQNVEFILHVLVQGLVGVVTLILFDREVRDMLNVSAASLVEKYEKDDPSVTRDSSTPTSYTINNACKTPTPKVKSNNPNPIAKELKRKVTELYDVDAPKSESATKSAAKPMTKFKAIKALKLFIKKNRK